MVLDKTITKKIVFAVVFLKNSANCILQVISPVIGTNSCFEELIKDTPNVSTIPHCD